MGSTRVRARVNKNFILEKGRERCVHAVVEKVSVIRNDADVLLQVEVSLIRETSTT